MLLAKISIIPLPGPVSKAISSFSEQRLIFEMPPMFKNELNR